MDGAGNWDRIETPSTPIANEPSMGEGPMSSHPFPASSALWRRFLRCLMQGAADEAAHLSPLPCKAPHRVQGDGQGAASFAVFWHAGLGQAHFGRTLGRNRTAGNGRWRNARERCTEHPQLTLSKRMRQAAFRPRSTQDRRRSGRGLQGRGRPSPCQPDTWCRQQVGDGHAATV